MMRNKDDKKSKVLSFSGQSSAPGTNTVIRRKVKGNYGNIIREYRQRAGIDQRQLSTAFGYSNNTVSNWENGISRPDMDAVVPLCSYLHIPLGAFFGLPDGAGSPADELEVMRHYRLLNKYDKAVARQMLQTMVESETQAFYDKSRVDYCRLPEEQLGASAGTGNSLEGITAPEYIYVQSSRFAYAADEIIRVSGDSMESTFSDGDRLFVEHSTDLEPGEIGIFIIAGESFVKEYQRDGLHSHNPAYQTFRPGEDDGARCIGRVLGIVDPEQIATAEESTILEEIFSADKKQDE